jgi:hypothetical protein
MEVRLMCMVALAASLAGLAFGPTLAEQPPVPAAPSVAAPAASASQPTLVEPGAEAAVPTVATPVLTPDAGPPPGTIPAIWIEKELSFTYFGRTSLYYCDGLRRKVDRIMKQLGAMDGYRVRIRSCYAMGGPEMRQGPAGPEFYSGAEHTPRVMIDVAVPQRVTPELLAELSDDQGRRDLIARVRGERSVIGNTEAQFAARTRRVTFDDQNLRGRIDAGDCELMEQLRDKMFVPLGVNVVADRMSCTPNQVSRGSVKIELEVLEPWTPEPEPEPTADPAAAP